jgi:hypothetical protein
MRAPIILAYRHSPRSALPDRISARHVGQVAAEVRSQLGYGVGAPLKVDHHELIEGVRLVQVNGLAVRVEWALDAPVTDEDGAPALGSCEFDLSLPDHALVYVNAQEIGGREYLERSTALHELGHAIFDSPGWIVANRQGRLKIGHGAQGTTRVFRFVTTSEEQLCNRRVESGDIDWSEFRANEFMGAFLAPEGSLRDSLYDLCLKMRVPLVNGDRQVQLPGLPAGARQADFSGRHASDLEYAVCELARERGLSPSFIRVRLKKYGLVKGLLA